MPRGKDISGCLWKATAAVHQSGNCYNTISKQFIVHRSTGGKIIHKWKAVKTVVNWERTSQHMWPWNTQKQKIQTNNKNQMGYNGQNANKLLHRKRCIPTVMHSRGGVMIWGWRLTSSHELTTSLSEYHSISETNVRSPVWQLQFDWNWVLSGHKYIPKSLTAWLKKKRIRVLRWPIESPDLKL